MTASTATLLLASLAYAAPKPIQTIAVLPFLAQGRSVSGASFDVTEEFVKRWKGHECLVALDWDSLGRMLDGRRPNPAAVLISADAVVAGKYSMTEQGAVIDATWLSVRTGKVTRWRQRVARSPIAAYWTGPQYGVVVEPASNLSAEFRIDAKQSLALRDAVSDAPRAGVAKRVKALELRLADVESKYWALRAKADPRAPER